MPRSDHGVSRARLPGGHVQGTLVEEYGFLDVLAAARRLKDVRNDILVVIIGGGRDFIVDSKLFESKDLKMKF